LISRKSAMQMSRDHNCRFFGKFTPVTLGIYV
jgi:hypothetical protein